MKEPRDADVVGQDRGVVEAVEEGPRGLAPNTELLAMRLQGGHVGRDRRRCAGSTDLVSRVLYFSWPAIRNGPRKSGPSSSFSQEWSRESLSSRDSICLALLAAVLKRTEIPAESESRGVMC